MTVLIWITLAGGCEVNVNAKASSSSRIGGLQALPEVLRELRLEPREVFLRAGIWPQLFDNPDNRVVHEDICRLLWVCQQETSRTDFGLMVGSRFTLGDFGTLGKLLRHSSTVGEALQMLIQYLHHDDRAAVPLLFQPESKVAFLGYLLHHPAVRGAGQLLDAAMTVGYRIMETVCGSGWHCRSVQFSHRRPASIAPYQRIYGPTVYFDAEYTGFYFDAAWLDHPIAGADSRRRRDLLTVLQRERTEVSISFSEEVYCALYAQLATGGATAAKVAQLFFQVRRLGGGRGCQPGRVLSSAHGRNSDFQQIRDFRVAL